MRNKHKRTTNTLVKLPRIKKKGFDNKHILAETVVEKREYRLHATKGYRSNRILGD